MKKLIIISILLLLPSLSYATTKTFDFNYPGGHPPVSYEITYIAPGSLLSEVYVTDFAPGAVAVPSFYDSGVNFINATVETSPYSSDGYVLSAAGAAQYGIFGILLPSLTHSATVAFVQASVTTLSGWDFSSGSAISIGGVGANFPGGSNYTETFTSSAGFDFLQVLTDGAKVDTFSYDVPEPPTWMLLGCGLTGLGLMWKRLKPLHRNT